MLEVLIKCHAFLNLLMWNFWYYYDCLVLLVAIKKNALTRIIADGIKHKFKYHQVKQQQENTSKNQLCNSGNKNHRKSDKMGNSQATASARSTTAATTPNHDKLASPLSVSVAELNVRGSRRGSRAKVFSRFGTKSKIPQLLPTTSSTTTLNYTQFEHNISEEESPAQIVDHEQMQRNDELIRQLEQQQIRNKAKKPSLKKKRYFCKRNENDDDEHAAIEEARQMPKLRARQKRQAPKPPGQAVQQPKSGIDCGAMPITATSSHAAEIAALSPDTNHHSQHNRSDHCEFIESLFATQTTTTTTITSSTNKIIVSDVDEAGNVYSDDNDVTVSTKPNAVSDKPALGETKAGVMLLMHDSRIAEAKQNIKKPSVSGEWRAGEAALATTDVFDIATTMPSNSTEHLSSLEAAKQSNTNNASIEPESGGVMHDSIDPISPQTSLPSDVDEVGEPVTHFPAKFPRQRNKAKFERPLSEISVTSADTSALLSPITQKAIYELQLRHRADKLTQLSISKTTVFEIAPDATLSTALNTSSEQIETEESSDEHMALQLGKKLAQVLGNTSANGAGVGNIIAPAETHNATTITMPAGSEMFNIAKAKKIELQNLSSRLTAPTAQAAPTTTTNNSTCTAEATTLSNAAAATTGTDAKAVPVPVPHTTETQSTVIISFKSSQTPAQSQPSTAVTNVDSSAVPATTTTSTTTTTNTSSEDSLGVNASSALAAGGGSGATSACVETTPVAHCPGTPTNNVLRKVASFTAEKVSASATPTAAVNGNGAGLGSATHMENLTRRLSYVPEKLSFAAYEKFEGQMLMKWLMSSLQSNASNLNEQDISSLTLQYCNNLIRVGVLKQISEKNDVETFSPFQMYQWTYTEAPTTSIPMTPGKLDKTINWLNCSTPAGPTKIPKSLQLNTPNSSQKNVQILTQELRNRVLNCASIEEVIAVIRDALEAGDLMQRRPSKRGTKLTEALDASETTIYEYEDKVEEPMQTPLKFHKDIQTELDTNLSICRLCGRGHAGESSTQEVNVCEIGVQTEELIGDNTNDAANSLSSVKAPPPPPPPPPPFPVGDMPFNALNVATIPKPPPIPPPFPPMPIANAPQEIKLLTTGSSMPPAPPPIPSTPSAESSLTSLPLPPPPPPTTGLIVNIPNTGAPPSPKQPTATTPAPLPNPAECNWFNKIHTLRKAAVNPPKPMKPLYWTRIVTPPLPAQPSAAIASGDTTDSSSSPEEVPATVPKAIPTPKEIWQEIDETSLDNIDEFTELFSRRAVMPVTKPKETREVRTKTIKKVLDSKRSQNVGIVSRSLHVDFCEIEHAIYHVDTSVVSLETLQQIINVKATNEELEQIKKAAAETDGPLDYPEQFLLKISQISMSTERISCIVFQAEFEEGATLIARKLEIIAQLSQFLIESEDLKLVFSIILTLGNYMNGGNRQRGQADGFTLEILGKLKDVKSTQSNITLLHFIVRTYIAQRRKEGQQLTEMILPTPEPADVERAVQVDFDEAKQQISEMKRKLNACKKTAEKVIAASTEETLQPFKSKMEDFIESASKTIDKLHKELEECHELFVETMRFYHFVPKSCTLEQCTPDQFFEYWTSFSNDFKDIWKKEISALWAELAKKSRQARIKTATANANKATKAKPGGLKERIMRLSKK